MTNIEKIRILLITITPFPTVRPAVTFLYGKYLPQNGVLTTLVTHTTANRNTKDLTWSGGGELKIVKGSKSPLLTKIKRITHDLKAIINAKGKYDIILVRDKIMTSFIGAILAKILRVPFIYWLSYPFPEDDLLRVKVQADSMGIGKRCYKWLRGQITKFFLYRLLLPACDHVFVISEKMKEELILRGIDRNLMTPDPMGVDLDLIAEIPEQKVNDQRLKNSKVIVYLGALDRTRQVDFFFKVLKKVQREFPNTVLLLVGDAMEKADILWLKNRAFEERVYNNVVMTGWLPRKKAWHYVKSSDVGVCGLPSNYIFDTMSPTKAVEMMALGIPTVVHDHPDQSVLVKESGGGICVPYNEEAFSKAIIKIFSSKSESLYMRRNGAKYIANNRSYSVLGEKLANFYKNRYSIIDNKSEIVATNEKIT